MNVQVKTVKVNGRALNIKMFRQLQEIGYSYIENNYFMRYETVKRAPGWGDTHVKIIDIDKFVKQEVIGFVSYTLRGSYVNLWAIVRKGNCLYRLGLRSNDEFTNRINDQITETCQQIFL